LEKLSDWFEQLKMSGTVSTASAATSDLFNNKTVNRRLKRGKRKKEARKES